MEYRRKKPIAVRAWQLTEDNLRKGIPKWVLQNDRRVVLWTVGGSIDTFNGNYDLVENDWIIEIENDWLWEDRVRKELYPCKPDIFKSMYEEVD